MFSILSVSIGLLSINVFKWFFGANRFNCKAFSLKSLTQMNVTDGEMQRKAHHFLLLFHHHENLNQFSIQCTQSIQWIWWWFRVTLSSYSQFQSYSTTTIFRLRRRSKCTFLRLFNSFNEIYTFSTYFPTISDHFLSSCS